MSIRPETLALLETRERETLGHELIDAVDTLASLAREMLETLDHLQHCDAVETGDDCEVAHPERSDIDYLRWGSATGSAFPVPGLVQATEQASTLAEFAADAIERAR